MEQQRKSLTQKDPKLVEMNELLTRVAISSDRAAFEQLFEFFAPKVKGYLFKIGTSGELAEALAQETLLKVWRKAKLFDARKASASTWIFTIARNLRIDAARRAARGAVDVEIDEATITADEDPLADEIVERTERDKIIHDAFTTLPQNQLEVVKLHFLEDAAHTEISDRLNVPLGTVKSRLRLAFQKIRKEIGDLHA